MIEGYWYCPCCGHKEKYKSVMNDDLIIKIKCNFCDCIFYVDIPSAETTTNQNENKIIDDYYYGCRYSTSHKNVGGK